MTQRLAWFSLLLIALVFSNGCATMIVDRSQVSYVGGDFTPQHLRTEGAGMLPVVAGQGQEAYRRPMADQMSIAVTSAMGEGTFLDWRQTMEGLNAADLSDAYQSLIATYRETAILRRETVSKLGQALGVRYLLFVSLEEFHKKSSTSYSVFSGMQTTRKAQVNAFCQVWDCLTGDVVWEGAAAANSQGGELTYDKPYSEYARVAAEGVTRRLFQLAGKGSRGR